MGPDTLFFKISIPLLATSFVIVWLRAASMYKKMHPKKDFSWYSDQWFIFRKFDRNHELAEKYQKRRLAVLVVFLLIIAQNILSIVPI